MKFLDQPLGVRRAMNSSILEQISFSEPLFPVIIMPIICNCWKAEKRGYDERVLRIWLSF